MYVCMSKTYYLFILWVGRHCEKSSVYLHLDLEYTEYIYGV